VAESGSGKSALCRSVMELPTTSLQVEQGSVLFDGTEMVGTDRQSLWGKRMGSIFDDLMTSLNPR
jgi:ABC-type dipeptide/oligopeptide/nickel transport system ATPase component